MTIRTERPDDVAAVRHVLELAFGQRTEADLVDALRRTDAVTGSLVAVEDGALIGHVLFTRVRLDPNRAGVDLVALGPMGVLPACQRRGVGGMLVRAGLEHCRASGHAAVVVLGHPMYYPRFGFVPAREHGLVCEFDAPADAFMATELRRGSLGRQGGLVRYHEAFRSA